MTLLLILTQLFSFSLTVTLASNRDLIVRSNYNYYKIQLYRRCIPSANFSIYELEDRSLINNKRYQSYYFILFLSICTCLRKSEYYNNFHYIEPKNTSIILSIS